MDKLFVVVTGSSSGLGFEISKILLESENHSVIGLDIKKTEIQSDDFYFIESDLSNRSSLNQLVEEIGKLSGNSLYGIVNVAGISVGKSIVGMNDGDWDKMIEVNLTAPALLISKLQDSMMDGGRIVNVSSPVSVTGSNKPGYSASKAGMHGLTMSVAKNLGPRNILVNTVFPGPMITGMTQKWSQEKRDSIATESFLGRLTTPEEVARGIKFLLDPSTTGITGSVLDFTAGSMFTH
ncbi:MAG: SDR family NAD(P)-dependent oxidoreductase [Candidatus Poseidoniaceae archaeon]